MTNQTAFIPAGSAARANAIETRHLTFRWPGQTDSIIFPDITLARGEHLFLHGPSGTGKSTLLSLLAGMLAPETGSVRLLGEELSGLRAGRRDRFRANHMGVIFQQFNLVPYLSAMGNVTLPCRLSTSRRARTTPDINTAASMLLEQLAIPEDERHRSVTTLSIGQQQRVAAARALIGAPEIILADEPTSALDTDNRDRFLDLLLTLAGDQQSSVVFVSHDRALAQHFHQQAALGDPA
ncbi:MAG: ABC transporter ATP-binding protein [Pseudomonadota bacterium]